MYHIIVLNLQRSIERKQLLEEQFKKLQLTNYTFFPCFDGKDNINMSFSAPIIKGTGLGRKLERNEIAIIMSHIAALKHAQVMQYDNVVILEDDVVLCEDWGKRLDILFNILPEDWEYVYLAGHSDFVQLPMFETPAVIKAPRMTGAFSYMVSKEGLDKVIKYSSEFVTTYDDMINLKIVTGKLNGYYLAPFMTYHRDSISTLWEGVPSLNHPSIKYFKNKLDD